MYFMQYELIFSILIISYYFIFNFNDFNKFLI